MKKYGDEGFISILQEGQENARNKDIQKGSVFAGDKELLFQEREILKNQMWMWLSQDFSLLGKELVKVKYYNLMFFLPLKGRLLMGSCNCPAQDQQDWKELFVQMITTIRTA